VKAGVALVKLVRDLEPHEILCVHDHNTGEVTAFDIIWRKDDKKHKLTQF